MNECYATFKMSYFATLEMLHWGSWFYLGSWDIRITLFPESMPADHLASALDGYVRSLQFRPNTAFDVILRHLIIVSVIADRRSLEDPAGLLVYQDELQLVSRQAPQGFGIKVGRTLFIDPFMFMREVVVIEPFPEGFIDISDGRQMQILQDEVPLDEPEQALDLSFGLGFPTVNGIDPELAGVPLVIGLTLSSGGLEVALAIREKGFR